jgi:hypothetical protein
MLVPIKVVGPAAPEHSNAAWSQSASFSSSLFSATLDGTAGHEAAFPKVSTVHTPVLEDEVCLPPDEEDECLTPEVLLHIAYEVVSQLYNTEDFSQLLLEECSLQDFLVEQIHSSQPVVEA